MSSYGEEELKAQEELMAKMKDFQFDISPTVNFKFNEDIYIDEISDYIMSTYSQHYSKKKFQAAEFIYDAGHGTGFNMGNVMKYAQRYGNKGTPSDARKDLMKVIHYAILQLYVHDKSD